MIFINFTILFKSLFISSLINLNLLLFALKGNFLLFGIFERLIPNVFIPLLNVNFTKCNPVNEFDPITKTFETFTNDV